MNQTDCLQQIRELRKVLFGLGKLDLYQKIAGSKSKTELQNNLAYTLKSLQSDLAQVENNLSVPEKIGQSVKRGKPALHFDLTPGNGQTVKPFQWDSFGKAMVNRIFKGKR